MKSITPAAVVCLFYLSLAVPGCHKSDTSRQEAPAPSPALEARLLEIAGSYFNYLRADEVARMAPTDCRWVPPATAHVSDSGDAQTHGRKLYSLFVKDRAAYLALDKEPQPVGQFLVKESWAAEQVEDDGVPLTQKKPIYRGEKGWTDKPENWLLADQFVPYARKDGKLYHAVSPAGLFIMLKLDPATPETDNGWVYATVTADHKTVTARGRIATCMKCHQDASHDRLFGVPNE